MIAKWYGVNPCENVLTSKECKLSQTNLWFDNFWLYSFNATKERSEAFVVFALGLKGFSKSELNNVTASLGLKSPSSRKTRYSNRSNSMA